MAIGSEINTHLLDKIAERTRTFRTYIAAGEDIESGISRFYDKIRSPVLSDVRLRISGNVRASANASAAKCPTCTGARP